MAAEKEGLDFLTKVRIRELILMGLITITAVVANLPQDYVEQTLGVSPTTMIAVLAIAVIFGLFLYLKFFFFVAVVLSSRTMISCRSSLLPAPNRVRMGRVGRSQPEPSSSSPASSSGSGPTNSAATGTGPGGFGHGISDTTGAA